METNFIFAEMVDEFKIRFSIAPAITVSSHEQLKIYKNDIEIKVKNISDMRAVSDSLYIELDERLDISENYHVVINNCQRTNVVPTKIFDSRYFSENFHYNGTDLGAVICDDKTAFKVWAPTASRVVLNLFTQGHGTGAYKTIDMLKCDKGVWYHTEKCGHGTYYTYSVTTSAGTQEAVDPYAKAAGINGNRGMVVDLGLTNPPGWDKSELQSKISSYSEAIIWEVHIRDFSNKIAASRYKGKYLAFTEKGLVNEHGQAVGIDYLKELGITHVHLLPFFDYATVNETAPNAAFNWGYDPKNYNVPEGSYSVCPENGENRIRELKELIMALHAENIGVIMDVVYNHTHEINSDFNKIVPYYYYRYNEDGKNSSASGCGNDTASERYMYSKFMVESTAYWMKEYKLDGLRFDLMGLHDLNTMQKIERAVHSINPHAIIYGEGWTMGFTIDGSLQANQYNIGKIIRAENAIGGIAVFNDVIRDGLKGSAFSKTSRGYINGDAKESLARVLFGINGGKGFINGWSVENDMVINYMSAHDNNTLWDKLSVSNPDNTDEERAAMNRLGAAIIMISRGTPFWQAGEEMLRSKGGDENSYKSSDDVNNIDWSRLEPGSLAHETMLYYKGLIKMRKASPVFTSPSAAITDIELHENGLLALRFDENSSANALVLVNPYSTALSYHLDREWNLITDKNHAGSEVIARESGDVTVDAISVRIYVNDAFIK